MKWRIVFGRTAEKELAKLSSEMQLRVARAIRALQKEPVPSSASRLRGSAEFRVRVGDYRVLYLIEHHSKTITISAIGHRREVYRRP